MDTRDPRGMTLDEYWVWREQDRSLFSWEDVVYLDPETGKIVGRTTTVAAKNWAAAFIPVVVSKTVRLYRWLEPEEILERTGRPVQWGGNTSFSMSREEYQAELDEWHRYFHPES